MPTDQIGMQTLQKELEEALSLIRGSSSEAPEGLPSAPSLKALTNTESLLDRCSAMVSEHGSKAKPTIRVVRHLACSGGTLVSKCMAAMPNVYLLSELHPESKLHMDSGKAKFLPADVVTQARYARVPEVQELANDIFLTSVKLAHKHTEKLGGHLVIRAHSHSDYCVGSQPSRQCAVSSVLADYFDVKAIATVRHPLDAYLSLVKNDWAQFEPNTFDEYCRRALAFLEDQETVFSYEEFVKNPMDEVQSMTNSLGLVYDDSFIDTFGAFNVTGDSGRSGDVIAARPRQHVPDELAEEADKSSSYFELVKLMENLELL